MDELVRLPDRDLLALSRNTLHELRTRGVIRSDNAPAGDYAEYLICEWCQGKLAPPSEKSWDVQHPDGRRFQVKARLVSEPRRAGQDELSVIRSWDFDALIAVLFADDDFRVLQAVEISCDSVRELAHRAEWVRGWRLRLTPTVLARPEIVDLTEEVRATASRDVEFSALSHEPFEDELVDPPELQLLDVDDALSRAIVLTDAPDEVQDAVKALYEYIDDALSRAERARRRVDVPSRRELLWPTLSALGSLAGSAQIDELNRTVADRESYSPELRTRLHSDGPQTELEYRLAWSRTLLKAMGLLENPARGSWSLTELGRGVREMELEPMYDAYMQYLQARRRSAGSETGERDFHGRRRIAVLWPSGNVNAAQTWEELEAQLRGGWNPSDPDEFRVEMRHRAQLWSGATIPAEPMTSEQFFGELARANALLIAPEEPEGEDAVRRLEPNQWATPYRGVHVFRDGPDEWKISTDSGHDAHRGIRNVDDAVRWAKILCLPQYEEPLPPPTNQGGGRMQPEAA